MRKISRRDHPQFQKISKRDLNAVVREMKERVKKDPAVIKKFKEYGVPIEAIDKVHVELAELPVSAKTKDMKIYLNIKMLQDDSEVDDPAHYLAHEIIHVLQQMTGNVDGHEVKDYLSKPTEEEAFGVQVDFKKRNEGEEEAEDVRCPS